MTILLAIDTASPKCAVALLHKNGCSIRESAEHRQAAQQVLPMINTLLKELGIGLQELDVIGVNAGPGSFTGLRIGVAAAQGLSLANALPVVPVSSLAIMARAAAQQAPGDYYLVADKARENEVYFAVYQSCDDGDVVLLGREQVNAPESLAFDDVASLANSVCIGIGDGWIYRDQIESALNLAVVSCLMDTDVRLKELCALARIRYMKGEHVSDEQVLPNYVKEQLDYSS